MKNNLRIGMSVRYLGTCPETGRADWQVNEPLFMFGNRVSNGFITDGGSIPLVFAWFLNPTGQGFPAFVVHDWQYNNHQVSRYKADRELRRNMQKLGCGLIKSWIAFCVVRVCGHSHWVA